MIRVAFLASTVTALVGPQHRRPPSARSAEATLGLGCFWEPSETLLKLDGVEATRCGYAGAAFPHAKPDYNSVCGGDGNVEAVRITYDDSVVAYEAVLDAAFAASKPVLGSRQYAPIVFAANDAEAERAAAWVAKGGVRDNGLQRKQFSVEQTDTFWLAEGYHQEYWQKWRPRYAVLFGLIALQYADSKLDMLPLAADTACNVLVVGIGLLFLGERVLDSETTKV
jgi:methionine-S-sulfoxide reductase